MAARDLPHIILANTARAEGYAPPLGRGKAIKLRERSRTRHGQELLDQLRAAWSARDAARTAREAIGQEVAEGVYLEFRSDPGAELAVESLADRRAGIELVAVRRVDDTDIATVFVPHGKVGRFIRKIEAYIHEDTRKGRPKNQSLVASIGAIRAAVLESFWTDEPELYPAPGQRIVWEIWLRRTDDRIVKQLERLIGLDGIDLLPGRFDFAELTVVLAVATVEALTASIDVLDVIAELRLAKSPAAFLERPSHARQQIEQLRAQLVPAPDPAPAVCLLDSGVDRAHPLLAQSLSSDDEHVYDPTWPRGDATGHGTEMAGLAVYGDLIPALVAQAPVQLEHRLESVKVVPPTNPHNPLHYGDVTAESVYRAEQQAPQRLRTFCMSIMAKDSRDRGRPSLWSGAIDDLAAGTADDTRRLFTLSAGNVRPSDQIGYIDRNLVDDVHDPGQAWNALTIGAYTERVAMTEPHFAGWTPLAGVGELSPCSTTSVTWERNKWPIKPELVIEGGNSAIDATRQSIDTPESLSLLTTSRLVHGRLLAATGDTSAAAAQGARLGVIVHARYPTLWPETVRALLVHSAEWTDAMVRQARGSGSRRDIETGLRMFGYGVPSLERASASAANDLTLIVQAELQPFDENGRMHEMHVHELPWPRDVLLALGETKVEMRVTLSYFVEASPGRRGWGAKHRYASHGLRFDVRTATETLAQFRARMNRAARSEDIDDSESDSDEWWLGRKLRSKGSIHHDRWRDGTAADLAERSHLAVYPVLGWWRERRHLGRATRRSRYALVVGIRATEAEVDLYTPVSNQVGILVPAT